MRRPTVYTIILGCYMVVLAVLGASLWLNDERLAVIGLLAFTGLVQATPLQLQVYNPGEAAVFPVSSTLISGEREAILVDAQFSTREAAELVRLVQASGKRHLALEDPEASWRLVGEWDTDTLAANLQSEPQK